MTWGSGSLRRQKLLHLLGMGTKHVLATAYEKLVRDLYQALMDQSQVKNVEVQHDVKLKGKSGERHQIDVHWKFEAAGVVYPTCIECRYFTSKIKKSHVAAFSRIVADIDGARGIMVTTVGYQSGALGMAKADGSG